MPVDSSKQQSPDMQRLLETVRDLRQEPSAETVERAFQKAQPVFQEIQRKKQRSRLFYLGYAMTAVLAISLYMFYPKADGLMLHTAKLIGTVHYVDEQGVDQLLTTNTTISENMVVKTDLGRVQFQLADGSALFLNRETQLTVTGPDSIYLTQGGLYLDTDRAPDANIPLAIETDMGTVQHIGTRYQVIYEQDLAVQVRNGEVLIATSDGEEYRVQQGRESVISADRSYVEKDLQDTETNWQWVDQVENHFDIEGKTYAEFVTWYQETSGKRVRYADQATRLYAERTPLSGNINDLDPDQAFVLLTEAAGLTQRLENTTVVVSFPSD